MKKRVICLLLSAVMLLMCLAGCAEDTGDKIKEEIGEKASVGAVTLSMYLMSEAPVSDAQKKLMEEKVNEITESEFKIHLNLHYYTESEYYAKLEENLDAMNRYYADSNGSVSTEKPVYTDENKLPVVYYPPIEAFDVDLFYFSGYDRYTKYVNEKYLQDLTDDVKNNELKKIRTVISSTLLDTFSSVNGGKYYAIPANRPIGEYTYLLLNKNALRDTLTIGDNIKSISDCATMMSIINSTETHKSKYVPLYTGGLNAVDMVTGTKYLGSDSGVVSDSFSVMAGSYTTTWTGKEDTHVPAIGTVDALTAVSGKSIKDQLIEYKGYESKGYFATEADLITKDFAVGYLKGGPEIIEQYGDEYQIIEIEKPLLTHADLYESMFGIHPSSNSVTAGEKILTYINTNTEFRNLLLYGVEGENYKWVDSDVLDENGDYIKVIEPQVAYAEKIYSMSAIKTGNVALAYPTKDNPRTTTKICDTHNSKLIADYAVSFVPQKGIDEGKLTADDAAKLIEIKDYSERLYAALNAATADTIKNYFPADTAGPDGTKAQGIIATDLEQWADTIKNYKAYYDDWKANRNNVVAPPETETPDTSDTSSDSATDTAATDAAA